MQGHSLEHLRFPATIHSLARAIQQGLRCDQAASFQIRYSIAFPFDRHCMNAKRRSLIDKFSKARLTPIQGDSFQSDQSYHSVVVRGADLSQSRNSDVVIEHSHFDKVDISGGSWTAADLTEILFSGCTLSNLDCCEARFTNNEFHRARATGLSFSDGRLRNVLFSGCKLDLSIFQDAQLANCRFEDCDLREADFQRASLKQVVFRDCDLRNARFVGSSLEILDLRGSHVAGIQIDAEELRGTIVDPHQIADFAPLLGVVVEATPARN